MRAPRLLLLPALVAPLLLTGGAARAGDGKAVFLANKCNKCHTVSAVGISRLPPEEGETDVIADLPTKPPDLSDVGHRHEASWMKGFVLKEIEKDGKKHLRKFKGTDAELADLVGFLAGLKTPVAPPAGGS